MRRKLIVAMLLAAGSAAAGQIQPLPTNPLLKAPTPTVAPLAFETAPRGTITLPINTGTGAAQNPDFPLPVRTKGGGGKVTLTLTVDGTLSTKFSLIDPPTSQTLINTQLGGTTGTTVAPLNLQAPAVSKMMRFSGNGSIPATMPDNHTVTLVARDSNGNEARAGFVVRFARAKGKPAITTQSSPIKEVRVDRSVGFNEAQLAALPAGEVPFSPYNRVTLSAAGGGIINWHPSDPDSEIICIYGSFRYACELDGSFSNGALSQFVTVRVPDIGRGRTVKVALKGPYGESSPVTVTIDSKVTSVLREPVRTAEFGGKKVWQGAPAIDTSNLLNNASTRRCDEPWLVWDSVDASGKVFYLAPPGALPIKLGFAGQATNRLVSLPKGQRITNDRSSWAVFESDVPPGIGNFFRQDISFTYFTLVGECAAKRR